MEYAVLNYDVLTHISHLSDTKTMYNLFHIYGIYHKANEEQLVKYIVKNDHDQDMEKFINYGGNPCVGNNYALICYINRANVKMVRLLSKDPRIDLFSGTFFQRAIDNICSYDVALEFLKDPRVDTSMRAYPVIQEKRNEWHIAAIETLKNYREGSPSRYLYEFLEAACKGDIEFVKGALKSELPVAFEPIFKRYALTDAAKFGHVDIVRLLLEDPIICENNEHAIRQANKNGHVDVLACIIQDTKAIESYEIQYYLESAIWEGHVDVVKFWLKDKNVDPSRERNRNLLIASGMGHYEIVEIFLDDERVLRKGYEPCIDCKKRYRKSNSVWDTPRFSLSGGNIDIAALLIEKFSVRVDEMDTVSENILNDKCIKQLRKIILDKNERKELEKERI